MIPVSTSMATSASDSKQPHVLFADECAASQVCSTTAVVTDVDLDRSRLLKMIVFLLKCMIHLNVNLSIRCRIEFPTRWRQRWRLKQSNLMCFSFIIFEALDRVGRPFRSGFSPFGK